jgi:hypothetical protein
MAKGGAGGFTVQSDIVPPGRPAGTLPVNGPAEHAVQVKNRSTLPYDVSLRSLFPDPLPSRALSYVANPTDSWDTSWPLVAGWQTVHARRDLDLHGPAAVGQRLHCVELRYRLANPATPIGAGGLWIAVSLTPQLVSNVTLI